MVVRKVVKRAFDVGIEHPFLDLVWPGQDKDFLDGVMAASAWAKSITRAFQLRFPSGFKRIFHHRLKTAIHHDGHTQSTLPHYPREFRDG